MVRVKVVGPLKVAGVARPGTVELDPSRVNIRGLVRGGHVSLPESVDQPVDEPPADEGGAVE